MYRINNFAQQTLSAVFSIKEMIALQNKSHKRYLEQKTTGSRNHYVDVRFYLKLAIKSEKEAYIKYIVTRSKNNYTKLWHHVGKLGASTKVKSN